MKICIIKLLLIITVAITNIASIYSTFQSRLTQIRYTTGFLFLPQFKSLGVVLAECPVGNASQSFLDQLDAFQQQLLLHQPVLSGGGFFTLSQEGFLQVSVAFMIFFFIFIQRVMDDPRHIYVCVCAEVSKQINKYGYAHTYTHIYANI